jgi:hypothetical protein
MVNITHRKKATDQSNMVYSSTSLSIAQVPYSEGLPIPSTPVVLLSEEESVSLSAGDDKDFCQANASKEPHVSKQQELGDLIRDLGLTKSNAEILTPCLN